MKQKAGHTRVGVEVGGLQLDTQLSILTSSKSYVHKQKKSKSSCTAYTGPVWDRVAQGHQQTHSYKSCCHNQTNTKLWWIHPHINTHTETLIPCNRFTLTPLIPLTAKTHHIEFLNECLSVFGCQYKALILGLSSVSTDSEYTVLVKKIFIHSITIKM